LCLPREKRARALSRQPTIPECANVSGQRGTTISVESAVFATARSPNYPVKSGAEELCAAILAQNKCEGRFAIDWAKAGRALRLTPGELLELVNQVLACELVRVSSNRIELTAAGIFVAKACLNLSR
jgi:hypothetical protein